MPYITQKNLIRLLNTLKLHQLPIEGEVYSRPIYFYNAYETKELLAFKSFLESPHDFIENFFPKLTVGDSYSFVFEGQPPASHKHLECDALSGSGSFTNYIIPDEIKSKDSEFINKYREWVKENRFKKWGPGEYESTHLELWGTSTVPKAVTVTKSESETPIELDASSIEHWLNSLLTSAGKFYHNSDKNKEILGRFSKATFLLYKNHPIQNNNTNYTDQQIKEVLLEFENLFKKPIKELLLSYYRALYNPDLDFEESLLEKVGFRKCKGCENMVVSTVESKIVEWEDL